MKPSPTSIDDAVRAEFAPFFESAWTGSSFRNPWQHASMPTLTDVFKWKAEGKRARPAGYRATPLHAVRDALASFEGSAGAATRLFWIGHASFLLELDGARFVIDPIFGRAGGLVPRVTPAAASAAQLTGVAAVLLTHGHHDHLDPSSLEQLARANEGRSIFVTPRGLAATLPRACRPAIELDWWQYVTIQGVRVHLVPAQHWHRRGMFDHNKSLWGGYVLEGTHRLFHSGDTGYFEGFRAIGRAFGGIDAACLPLGAYEPRWFMGTQHMSPEQSLTAMRDLAATHFVGMHWGAFDLSDEPIEQGPEIVQARAAEQGLSERQLHVVVPGGSVDLHGLRGRTEAHTRHRFAPR